jgi:hypothetical protein
MTMLTEPVGRLCHVLDLGTGKLPAGEPAKMVVHVSGRGWQAPIALRAEEWVTVRYRGVDVASVIL